jgi:hypothetical protein
MLNTNLLFVFLIWGSIGVGYFIYGKKQRSWMPMAGGFLMIGVSYLVGSVLLMTLICVGIVATVMRC